jgi:hypothetical protein
MSQCPTYKAQMARKSRANHKAIELLQKGNEQIEKENSPPVNSNTPTATVELSKDDLSHLKNLMGSVRDKQRFKDTTKTWHTLEMKTLAHSTVPSKVAAPKGRRGGPPSYSPAMVMHCWLNRLSFGTSVATARALDLQLGLQPFLKLKNPSEWSVRQFYKWGQEVMFEPLLRGVVQQLKKHRVLIHTQFDSTTLRVSTGSVAAILLVCWAPEDSPVWVRDLTAGSASAVLLHPSVQAKSPKEMVKWLGDQLCEHTAKEVCNM